MKWPERSETPAPSAVRPRRWQARAISDKLGGVPVLPREPGPLVAPICQPSRPLPRLGRNPLRPGSGTCRPRPSQRRCSWQGGLPLLVRQRLRRCRSAARLGSGWRLAWFCCAAAGFGSSGLSFSTISSPSPAGVATCSCASGTPSPCSSPFTTSTATMNTPCAPSTPTPWRSSPRHSSSPLFASSFSPCYCSRRRTPRAPSPRRKKGGRWSFCWRPICATEKSS